MNEVVVERWWNGTFGRLARRDLWLIRDDAGWHVRARAGDGDSPTATIPCGDEASARAQLELLLTDPPDRWRRLDR